ncbi:MAG: hypothetical protein KDE27_08055 [Planctomycetes bacterium]|nr:hypothetical protein [Planctomycetota bacterium]
MRLDDFRVDPDKLRGGIVWDLHSRRPTPDNRPHLEHICFLIMPDAEEFEAAMYEALEPFRAELRRGLDPEVRRRIRGEVRARVTLRNWWNLEIGTPPELVEYSVEKAIELLTDPAWEFVRRFVESAAANEQALLAKLEEDDRGN